MDSGRLINIYLDTLGMPENPDTPEQKQQLLTWHAQDPVTRLEAHFEKGCLAAVKYLISLRDEIKQSTIVIENPDPDFAQFYRYGNNTIEHWAALTRLLQRSGHDKVSIQSSFMDLVIQSRPAQATTDRSQSFKALMDLQNRAIEEVYGV